MKISAVGEETIVDALPKSDSPIAMLGGYPESYEDMTRNR